MSKLAKLFKPAEWPEMLQAMARELPWALAGLLLLLGLVALSVWWLTRSAKNCGDESILQRLRDRVAQTFVELRAYREAAVLRSAFRDSLEAIRRARPGGSRYDLPWFMVLGESGAGKSTLLAKMGLAHRLGRPSADSTSSSSDCGFWLFDQGLVLDVRGELVLRRGGRSADESSWRILLKQIRRARKRRPLDGVVVTIPLTSLVDPSVSAAKVSADAGRRAEALYQKIWQAQTELGMSLPVYVVITKADRLRGFEALGKALGPSFDQQMFGWSNPYALASPYDNAWVDEAFGGTAASLAEIYTDVVGGEELATQINDPLVFSSALEAVKEPARIFLNQIFSPSAMHDPFPFRGLYLTAGDFGEGSTEEVRAASENDPSGSPTRVLFAEELFRDKIFLERSLAAPSKGAQSDRRKRKWRLAAATIGLALLGSFALWSARADLAARVGKLEPFLRVVAAGLATEAAPSSGPSGDAGDLLTQARIVPTYGLRSVPIPGSWIGSLDRAIRKSATATYARNVLPGLDKELAAWIAMTPEPVEVGSSKPQDYSQSPEFLALEQFVGAPLNGLLQRTYGQKLEPPTRGAVRFYRRIFDDIQVEPLGSELPLDALAQKLAQDFFKSLYADNPVAGDLELIGRLSSEIEAASRKGLPPDGEAFQKLQQAMEKLEGDLSSPELAWMAGSSLDLGKPFEQLLDQIGGSPAFGKDVSAELASQAQTDFQQFKKGLADAKLSFGDQEPILAQKNGELELALSEGSETLSTALADLGNSLFAQDTSRQKIKVDPGTKAYFTWDKDLLKRAAALFDTYQDFTDKDLALFPEELQSDVNRLALTDLGGAVVDFTARAQQSHGLPSEFTPGFLENVLIKEQLTNLQAAEEQFEAIFGVLAQLDLGEDYQDLEKALSLQRETLLQDLDTLLETRDAYRPAHGDFSWWQCSIEQGCSPPLAEGAFDQRNAGELPAYLAVQRKLVSSVAADYADPILNFMAARLDNATTEGLASNWDAILQDLEDYKNKKAGNPISQLEEFVTVSMPKIDLAGCLAQVPDLTGAQTSSDFFTQRLQKMQVALRARCIELVEQEGERGYLQIAQTFEDRLSGLFPFSAAEPGISDLEASPGAVAAFYEVFDLYQAVIGQVPVGSAIFGTGKNGQKTESDVRAFMEDMTAFRAFVAPFLDDPKKYPEPTIDFEVAFRVNRSREQGANQIMRWSLESGDKTISMGGKETGTRWAYGMPLKLELGWADNSQALPVDSGKSPYSTIRGRTVVYEYPTQWGFISLLRDHPSVTSDFDDPREDRPETLKFEVETASAEEIAAASKKRKEAGSVTTILDTRSDTFWEVIETLKRSVDAGSDLENSLTPPPDTLKLAIETGSGETKKGKKRSKKKDSADSKHHHHDATTSLEKETATAFVRLLLTTPDKKAEIAIGPTPALAPNLPSMTTPAQAPASTPAAEQTTAGDAEGAQ